MGINNRVWNRVCIPNVSNELTQLLLPMISCFDGGMGRKTIPASKLVIITALLLATWTNLNGI
ncbi:MAG: hypothetical protein R2828_01095 [Saprospiraceae bacterium]